MPPLQIDLRIVELELSTRRHISGFREELVKIAFEQLIGHGQPGRTPEQIGERCARYADAVIAAMEKEPETKPAATTIQLIRQRLQKELDDQRAHHVANPAHGEKLRTYRDGVEDGLVRALAILTEMEKEPEMSPYERKCHDEGLNLCTGEPDAE